MNPINFAQEAWKQVNLGEGFTNNIRIEVSNFGRIRSYNKINNGKLLNGSMINGYKIIRLKLFKPRAEETTKYLQGEQALLVEQTKKIKELKKAMTSKTINAYEMASLNRQLETDTALLKKNKKIYDNLYNKEANSRTIYYAALIHRLVAEYFLPAPAADKTIVTHIDHDKLNNKVTNLLWINAEEKNAHQKLSPLVIAEKEKRRDHVNTYPDRYKLSVTKVMYLKKLLNEGKPIRNLAKQFKITETQVVKIKNQENWGSVEAAK